jgi:hypothetical protein
MTDEWRRLGQTDRVYVRPEEDLRLDVPATASVLVLSASLYDEVLRRAPQLEPIPNPLNSRLAFASDGAGLLVHFPLYGSPRVAAAIEQLRSLGVRRILGVGLCGSLSPRLPVGTVVLPVGAVRGDAVGLHYAPEVYPAVPDDALVEWLRQHNPTAQPVVQLSTDALYRETYDFIEYWRRLGVRTIDMETATQFVVARVLGVATAWIGVVSDLLHDGRHDGTIGAGGILGTAAELCLALIHDRTWTTSNGADGRAQ